jgi:colanic acid biosynthesis glycosyl transferase WcaI
VVISSERASVRILFLGTQFEPEITALAPFNTDLCKYLVSQGHEVTAVVGFPSYPQWRVREEYRGKWYAEEDHDGVRVIRVRQYVPQQPRAIGRVLFDTSFSVAALLAALRLKRPDVILAACSPLQIGVTAAALGWLWRRPFVFHIQDLLPESATEVGLLTNRRIIKLTGKVADVVYRRAAAVSAIGHGFIASLRRRGVPDDKLVYLPNWVDVNKFDDSVNGGAWRAGQSIPPDAFVAMYIGNFGFKQDMSVVGRAAEALRHESGITFVLVGEGSDRPKVTALAESLNLSNLQLLEVQPAADLPAMAAAADIFLVHQSPDVIEMVVPSKLLTYGAAGRPIVVAGNPASEGARFVQEGRCGHVVAPESPMDLAKVVKDMSADRACCRELGVRAREYVAANFGRQKVLAKLEVTLEDAATAGSKGSSR